MSCLGSWKYLTGDVFAFNLIFCHIGLGESWCVVCCGMSNNIQNSKWSGSFLSFKFIGRYHKDPKMCDSSNYSLKQRLIASSWYHERGYSNTSMDDSWESFRARFLRSPPWDKGCLRTCFSSNAANGVAPHTEKEYIMHGEQINPNQSTGSVN